MSLKGNIAFVLFRLLKLVNKASSDVEKLKKRAKRADVNLDHQFDNNDTLAGRGLNLYCLVSPQSFSCGNLVPWAFKADGQVTLLGKVSGGGSCAVGFITTAWGTSYRISDPIRLAFVKNGSYYDVDRGVEPDVFIRSYDTYFDRQALTELIHGIK